MFAPDDGYDPLIITVRDGTGGIVGGLLGETYWGWLHIDVLWLVDSARHNGFGSQMLMMAEQEAVRRGCKHAHLDTMSFQALPFYLNHGYMVFGALGDLPEGHSRYYLKKVLSEPG